MKNALLKDGIKIALNHLARFRKYSKVTVFLKIGFTINCSLRHFVSETEKTIFKLNVFLKTGLNHYKNACQKRNKFKYSVLKATLFVQICTSENSNFNFFQNFVFNFFFTFSKLHVKRVKKNLFFFKFFCFFFCFF